MNKKNIERGKLRFADFLVIIVFLFIAAFSLYLFRNDLLQTIRLKNVEPVGTVIIKQNTVQRRISSRVLWDRLIDESPVYLGDLIRVADLSAATLNIGETSIDIGENTLVRISLAPDGEGLQIDLSSGSLSVTALQESNVTVSVGGKQIQAGQGTVLNASVNDEGVSFQVNGGTARFIDEDGIREITSGDIINLNAAGIEVMEKAVVVTSPAPNVRYLKNTEEPLPVNFIWNRINLEPHETLRLEAALDRNFTRNVIAAGNLDSQARLPLDTGGWYWRLLPEGGDAPESTVISSGRLTIADGTGPKLLSPAVNSLFHYQDSFPVINFQWEEREGAVSYILEASNSPDFTDVQINRQSSVPYLTVDSLGTGLWYWRVKPEFPPVFNGSTAFSAPAFFQIVRGSTGIEEENLSDWLAVQSPLSAPLPPELPPELIPPQLIPPPQISLSSPANGTVLSGLTALREQTVFNWDTDSDFVSSRFVLSANPDPLQGPFTREIQNPSRAVSVDRLAAGTWYWTVEIQKEDGTVYSAQEPHQLVVRTIPLLPAPQNMQPARGTSYGFEDLRSRRNIVFSWSAVPGANAYIFTLYHQTAAGRRQIVRTNPVNRTNYTLENFSLLDRGTFIWQVEAVNIGRNNAIEQRGTAGENTLVLNFPPPGAVQIEDTGILYGN